jgi:predicted glycosyltransferase
MNLVRTRTPALVWPHAANREQGLRAERFAALGWLRVLGRADLEPERLAGLIRERLDGAGAAPSGPVDLSGAPATARILAAAVAARAERRVG